MKWSNFLDDQKLVKEHCFLALINVYSLFSQKCSFWSPQCDWNFKVTMVAPIIKFYFPFNLGLVWCTWMQGFQIWSQNWSLIIFDPFKKSVQNWQNTRFYQFSTVFWPNKGSNIIWFQFWDQISNPRINAHRTDSKLKVK